MLSRSRADLIRNPYRNIGGNPEEIVKDPLGDDLAPSYEVRREHGEPIKLMRRYFDHGNFREIENELKKLL